MARLSERELEAVGMERQMFARVAELAQREGYTLYRGTGVKPYGLIMDGESVIEGTLEEIETWLSNPT
jgi:hypothetical protein